MNAIIDFVIGIVGGIRLKWSLETEISQNKYRTLSVREYAYQLGRW